jgi:hypothetical protein
MASPPSRQEQQQRSQLQELFSQQLLQLQEQLPTQQQQDDEYLSAKRAAVEAVSIGRNTLEVVEQQGEQLENIERTADDTKYMLDKSNRILRGMTWSGWVTNMFTKDPSTTSASAAALANRIIPKVYDDNVPLTARSAAQAVQNYHANLGVLLESIAAAAAATSKQQQQQPSTQEMEEQIQTCQMICDNMFQVAWLEVSQLQQSCSVDLVPFCQRLALDLAALRDRQKKALNMTSTSTLQPQSFTQPTQHWENRNELLGPSSSPPKNASQTTTIAAAASNPHWQVQDEHLDFMSEHLDELRNIANSMSHVMDHHTERLESLHEKADDNLEVSKLVTRRADRLIQAKVRFLLNCVGIGKNVMWISLIMTWFVETHKVLVKSSRSLSLVYSHSACGKWSLLGRDAVVGWDARFITRVSSRNVRVCRLDAWTQ